MDNVRLYTGDMTGVYTFLLQLEDKRIPTVIVVEKEDDSLKGSPFYFYAPGESKEHSLLLIGNDQENMNMYLERAVNVFNMDTDQINAPVLDYPLLPFSQPLKIYKYALDICRELDIACPQIVQVTNSMIGTRNGFRYTPIDDNNHPIGDFILLRKRGFNYQLHSLAHELRHCWQEYKTDTYYKEYQDFANGDRIKHMFQPEEIDAEAYASLYLERKLGISNGTSFMYDTVEDERAWISLTAAVKKRMAELNT